MENEGMTNGMGAPKSLNILQICCASKHPSCLYNLVAGMMTASRPAKPTRGQCCLQPPVRMRALIWITTAADVLQS